jgi:hypothetical protein
LFGVKLIAVAGGIWLCGAAVAAIGPLPGSREAHSGAEVGNDACRPCHAALVERYAITAMARTSGRAPGNLIAGRFRHAASGVEYRTAEHDGEARLFFERPNEPRLDGSVRLDYYVGSNTRGRTYLYSIDGFLYQSPINYYAEHRLWDMSPGYHDEREMPLTHPAGPRCLFCHASRIQPTVPGTRNRFAAVPFLQAGVGCERCHGPGASHVRDPLHARMINPARLAPEARDSICWQCHLEGVSRIALPGRSIDAYRAGDRLADFVTTFVDEHAVDRPAGAVSQVESLAASRCSRESDGRLSCITCHDPHAAGDAAARVEHYREACLTCHPRFATDHHADKHDCTTCHMPRRDSADISHTEVTVHRIGVFSRARARPGGDLPVRLKPFGRVPPDGGARELGLAYVEIAPRGGTFGASEAFRLLTESAREHADDALVLARLAFMEQTRGDGAAAEANYRRSLALDDGLVTAAADLGVLLAQRGKVAEAIGLWRPAFDRNPDMIDLGVNLAMGECLQGDRSAAAAVLNRVLRFNPDSARARELLNGVARCGRAH